MRHPVATGNARSSLDRVVAVVNKDVIVQSELDREVQRILADLRRRGTATPPPQEFQRQVLEHLVVRRLQLQLADQAGINVGDDELNFALQNIAARNNMSLEQMREAVIADGGSFEDFREEVRNEMRLTQLRQKEVISRINISDAEVERFLAEGGDMAAARYHLAHILIALPADPTPQQLRDTQAQAEKVRQQLLDGADFASTAVAVSKGQQALEGGDLGWRNADELPPPFVAAVRNLQPGGISEIIASPSGFHILKLIEADAAGGRHVVQQTHVEHILVKVEAGREDEARARIESLRRRILAGEDFHELARTHSDDPGSAVKGGDLGWITAEEVVPQFAQAMQSLPEGELSEPVQSTYGFHLIRVLGRRSQDDTEAYRRAHARDLLRQRKAEEMTQAWLQRLRDEAYVEVRL
ncbi:peptidylprolyl isomerase [Immundisolibacter sp.]|uniref:peptidylprolyl isomerase n=1 Tax=Immundisolibacter sp. TaxID=1934948 RepID=UPI002606959B|nr:peptidylprolyl isomerase [Immundisolibacter sp.]MDD3649917.1 peptidylprolyl isomerase [Immundisolibacter sp.]